MDSCTPTDPQDNTQSVDDALDLDASESDVEGNTSTNTVIKMPVARSHTPSPAHPAVLNSPREHRQSSKESSGNRHSSRRRLSGADSAGKTDSRSDGSSSKRRRQWGSSTHDRDGSGVLSISSDALEKLVPTLTSDGGKPTPSSAPLPSTPSPTTSQSHAQADANDALSVELEVTAVVDSIDPPEAAVRSGSRKSNASGDSTRSKDEKSARQERGTRRHSDTTPEDHSTKPSTKKQSPKRKGPKETKAVGYLVEPPERVEPYRPAKHRPTDIVYIQWLVRPFTAEQLRQMIVDNYGPVTDLWLNKIKSTSIVRLESVEAAQRCREGLDGSRWPSMNPRMLHCDFGNAALFAWLREHGDAGDLTPPEHLVLGEQPDTSAKNTQVDDQKSKRSAHDSDRQSKRDGRSDDLRRKLGRTEEAGSSSKRAKPTEPATTEEAKKKLEEPAKLLDDLFRKTSATPSIYWLPLTPELAEKQATQRAQQYALKRSARSSAGARSTQRATRSPFTGPVPSEPTTLKLHDTVRVTNSEDKSPDKSKDLINADGISKERHPTSPIRSHGLNEYSGSRGRNKSPSSPLSKKASTYRTGRDSSLNRKRERSFVIPSGPYGSSNRRSERDRSPRANGSASFSARRVRSRSSSMKKSHLSRDSRPARSRRSPTSRSRSSTSPKGESQRRRMDLGSKPTRYARPRSRTRSPERRAISPPLGRSRDRPHR